MDVLLQRVLRSYPAIYLACHVRHPRAATNAHRINDRDANILGHLDLQRPMTPTQLAQHMGVTGATMSSALQRLETLGYVVRTRRGDDRRGVDVRITPAGASAMAATSVLDGDRVMTALKRLTPAQRQVAVDGLVTLAHACRSLMRDEGKQRFAARAPRRKTGPKRNTW